MLSRSDEQTVKRLLLSDDIDIDVKHGLPHVLPLASHHPAQNGRNN
jgi:hypothetical protein